MLHLKKLVFLFVIAAMLLAACQSPAPATTVATEPPAEPVATEAPPAISEWALDCAPNCEYKNLVVGFLQTGSEGGWHAANTASFKETAEQLGLTLKVLRLAK